MHGRLQAFNFILDAHLIISCFIKQNNDSKTRLTQNFKFGIQPNKTMIYCWNLKSVFVLGNVCSPIDIGIDFDE